MRRLTIVIAVLFFTCIFSFPALAWQVPDTGQTECYDDQGRTINCPESGEHFSGQDGSYLINPPSYTKLDESGNMLSDSAESWAMVKDNETGLIWEKKTNKDDVSNYVNPHDADNVYAWYDSNPQTNGGVAGPYNNGKNTELFIAELNSAEFGGFDDWRMPSKLELKTIAMYGPHSPGAAINEDFFPNSQYGTYEYYWTKNNYAVDTRYAWYVYFKDGSDGTNAGYKSSYSHYVRAVRGGN